MNRQRKQTSRTGGLKINSYETVDSYRISLGTVTSTIKPDNGNCFLEVNVTLTNLQEEAGRFDISVTDTVELFINSGAVGIYEDKSSYYPPQAERIASNDSVNLVWYFEIPENTDLSEAYIKIIPMFAGSTIAYFKQGIKQNDRCFKETLFHLHLFKLKAAFKSRLFICWPFAGSRKFNVIEIRLTNYPQDNLN